MPRECDIRNALNNIETAADGVDDPKLRSINRYWRIFGTFLRQNARLRICRLDRRGNDVLNIERGFAHNIPLPLPGDEPRIAQACPGQFTALLNRVDGNFKCLADVHKTLR